MSNMSASEEHYAFIESESIRREQLSPETHDFVVKATGDQTVGAGGMVRSVATDKTDYSLPLDGVMFERWAAHLSKATRPPTSYPKRNWMLALRGTDGERAAVMERAKESAVRHFIQWWRGDRDEDHGAALFFNVNLFETMRRGE